MPWETEEVDLCTIYFSPLLFFLFFVHETLQKPDFSWQIVMRAMFLLTLFSRACPVQCCASFSGSGGGGGGVMAGHLTLT